MNDGIKKIYLGLPEHIASKALWIERQFRVNELSYQPGGHDIVIEYNSGNVFVYDWIKRPSYYISKVLANEAREADMDFDFQDDTTILEVSKKLIKSAYCKYYSRQEESQDIFFEKVWDVTTASISVVEALKKYENEVSYHLSNSHSESQHSSQEEEERIRIFLNRHYSESETPYHDIALMYENEYKNSNKALKYYKKALAFHEIICEKYEKENPWRERIRNRKLYEKDHVWHIKLIEKIRNLREKIDDLGGNDLPF
ncbi:hypothetical protein GCM10023172_37620 [Hymenobacter ginsengisoli]|uniref:Tetratricopeptide repeat protein n=1 Tax=Hymenobacter ginsengisoli TaxID=1051626 RepID=A0ABP8QQW5_9BACT|nr:MULTISPECIES: hypothetical protein [unclassified Hymenobacter]MBO2032799.1 hypothetical protein [Hymenobacter sp. BT559]